MEFKKSLKVMVMAMAMVVSFSAANNAQAARFEIGTLEKVVAEQKVELYGVRSNGSVFKDDEVTQSNLDSFLADSVMVLSKTDVGSFLGNKVVDADQSAFTPALIDMMKKQGFTTVHAYKVSSKAVAKPVNATPVISNKPVKANSDKVASNVVAAGNSILLYDNKKEVKDFTVGESKAEVLNFLLQKVKKDKPMQLILTGDPELIFEAKDAINEAAEQNDYRYKGIGVMIDQSTLEPAPVVVERLNELGVNPNTVTVLNIQKKQVIEPQKSALQKTGEDVWGIVKRTAIERTTENLVDNTIGRGLDRIFGSRY